jgi:hypothetical protein
VKKGEKYYLLAYYNPAWHLFYPFYDDVNKSPVLKQSNAETYKDLINETNEVLNIDLEDKLRLAHKRFKEIFGCDCKIKPSKINEIFELKYSKTANLYSIYKLYNFVITDVDDVDAILKPKTLKCELFELDNLDKEKIIGNAVWFCENAKDELKKNAIKLASKKN